jgi:tRNA A37 threonylcarbamoyladenosine biosynthesis protein TsaE
LLVDNLNIIEWGEKNPHFWQEKKYLIVNLTKKNNSETRIIVIDIPFLFSPH